MDEARPTIASLYTVGYKHGGVETGLGFDPTAADINALEFLMSEPSHIGDSQDWADHRVPLPGVDIVCGGEQPVKIGG